jgi:hypothetical protein
MTPKRCLIAAALLCLAAIPCAALFAAPVAIVAKFATAASLLAFGVILAPGVKDAQLSVEIALPTGASSVYTAGIDLGVSDRAQFDGGRRVELLIEGPLLVVGKLANASTMTYEVQHDTDSAFGTAESLYGGPNLTQTGAGGVGAAAASKRVALPTDVKRYVRLKCTNSDALDASAVKGKLSLVF